MENLDQNRPIHLIIDLDDYPLYIVYDKTP